MNFKSITTERFREIIHDLNAWKTRSQELYTTDKVKERYLTRILPALLRQDHPQLYHLIVGPRRSGKSTVLWQTIRNLQHKGIPESQIFYLQMDHPDLRHESLDAITRALFEITPETSPKNPLYLVIDEIATAADWGEWLKVFHDSRKPFRILASSSGAAEIRGGSRESGPGRWAEHYLMPCNFVEYVEFSLGANAVPKWCRTGYKSLRERLKAIPANVFVPDEVKEAVKAQILWSGYPENIYPSIPMSDSDAVYERTKQAQEYLYDVAQKVIFRDIALSSGIRDLLALEDMLNATASRMSDLTMPGKIASKLEIKGKTAKDYIFHMERALLLFRLSNYSDMDMGAKSRSQKFCFYDTAMAGALRQSGVSVLEMDKLGKAFENFAGAALKELAMQSGKALNYWRLDNTWEVDFIFDPHGESLAFEVGSQSEHKKDGMKKLLKAEPRFANQAYVVQTGTPLVHPEMTKTGIGRISLPIFLLAVGAQSTQEALTTQGISLKNYIVSQQTASLYPQVGANKPQFSPGDVVFLTDVEAASALEQGLVEEGSSIARNV